MILFYSSRLNYNNNIYLGQLVTEDISRGTILVSDLRSQVADDEELSHLFKDFVPLYHRDQRIALNEWQEKAEPLMRYLSL